MPRAPKKCLEDGCRRPAITKGRCDGHYVPWAQTSPRNLTRPSNAATLMRRARHRDHDRCYVCGGPGQIVDHVKAVADGGSWELSNLACICPACHNLKSSEEAARGRARHR
ncbi:HNH endonuclease signature motif containing protein [Streptosporangium oxazolinicum]|uniref:HNH endonuclease signature motif containing protein n=1 Tax=Streptosporangium oxazolinicum TaxID=909287 RepID=A0ABP8BML3_9ACTN